MWTNWNDATRIGRRVYNRIRFLSARAAAFPLVFVLIGFVVQPPAALASEDYLREIKPIFQKRCYACHGALVQESALRIDTAASLLQGGDSGPAIVANSSAGSLLVERIRSTDDGFRMPPEGPPLTEQEIATIARWIDAGAPAPADEPPQPDPRSHWSFQPPTKSRLPVELSKSRGNAIDAFIDREHNRLGLQPLPPADKATLLRRVTLDLIGIPPSREELRAFLANNSPDAYERTVDRLLQRPEYGQRWGRHWMDVWRYSDWYGRRSVPDVMNSYPHIWRWRDWMVDALNEDIGYDEMVRQMLAADELYPGDDSKVVATGFLVRNWFKWNYESWMKDNVEHTGKAFLGLTFNCAHCHHHKYDPISQEDYFKLRAFFEPLELRQDRVPGLPDPGPFQKYVYTVAYGPIQAGLIRVFDEKLDAQTFFYTGGDARNRVMGSPSMVPGVPPFLRAEELTVVPVELPPEAYYPGLREFIRREEFAKIQNEVDIARAARDAARAACDEADKQYTMVVTAVQQPDGSKAANRDSLLSTEQARFDARCEVRIQEANLATCEARQRALLARVAADDAKYRALGPAGELAKAACSAEKQAAYELASFHQITAERDLMLAERLSLAVESVGTPDPPQVASAKAKVVAATRKLTETREALDAARAALSVITEQYSPLSPIYPARSTGRRSALAWWIANRHNPLTARVAVNHIWARHFGRPLVDSVHDFGHNGKRPSHPELLDWLAVEFMDHEWRMKPLHRTLVTSRAYCTQSHLSESAHPNLAVDPDNRMLWRFNARRLEAEVVRDSLLATSGELDCSIGGQEIEIEQWSGSKRRSLYFSSHGEAKVPFIDLFDGPNVCDCYVRTSSVRPQQALALSNSDVAWHQARVLAGRMWQAVDQPTLAPTARAALFVEASFEQVLTRGPREAERSLAVEFLAAQSEFLSQAIAAGEPLSAPPPGIIPPATDVAQRAREDFVHALYNHHDFVTLR